MLLLGIDAGSSSIKVSVIDGETGDCLAASSSPEKEMTMISHRPGWAEQNPDIWWDNMRIAAGRCLDIIGKKKNSIGAIGISYQMHGLVLVDRGHKALRDSIIWCDSRAVEYGNSAFRALGRDYCLSHLLNSPGNFTAAKLAWVRENEPDTFRKVHRIMLPGDYLAMRMTGEILTSFTGLSEGIFWDFKNNMISKELMGYFGFSDELLPGAVSSFSRQGDLSVSAAAELGLPAGIPVAYRAGDQPNNALSLNVLNPGEVAATAGTSGVIYGVTEEKKYDPLSRVNTFLHVNHSHERQRLGVLLCINGTGIMNSWIRRIAGRELSYDEMNRQAESIRPGSDGLSILPFGNGAERMLLNNEPGSVVAGLNFNTHSQAHLFRAVQEGIVFSFRYGLDIMKETGIHPQLIRAGSANMFLSSVFREALATITDTEIHLYNTDGSVGAARGAGIGCGFFATPSDAFVGLRPVSITTPDRKNTDRYHQAYVAWLAVLEKTLGDIKYE